jgi:hypothetical protein
VVALVLVGLLVLAGLGVGAFLLVRATTGGGTGPGGAPAALRDVTAAGLTFGVPLDWAPDPSPQVTIAGLPVEGAHTGPGYECGGQPYLRGFTAALRVGLELPPDLTAEQLAQLAGTSFYTPGDGTPADVRVSDARAVDIGGVQGQLAEATVTVPDDGCLATGGTVLVLAVPVAGGTSVLVVNGDTTGGPPDAPPVPARATLDAMVASARPAGI